MMTCLPFRCRACGELRNGAFIDVRQLDRSVELGFPAGTLRENYQHCSDREGCREAAAAWKGYVSCPPP